MIKPSNWNNLPMYRKILFYKKTLGEYHSKFVDKIEAKSIVKNILNDDIEVAPIIRILKDYKDISSKDFNENHILKATHGSGWNIDLSEINDINKIKNKLEIWNKTKLTHEGEMQYEYIEPRFFIEEKINDKFLGNTGNAIVYMFRCIHGKPVTFSVKKKSYTNCYDINLNFIKKKEFEFDISKINFEKMKKCAEILSNGFEFVRMDFYFDHNNKIYFSEYTFTPASGLCFYSKNLELQFGRLWI